MSLLVKARLLWIVLSLLALALATPASGGASLATPGETIGWGTNNRGQITIPTESTSGVSAIAGGGMHTLALKDGKALAWGSNEYGQVTVPEEAQSGVSAVAAGNHHSLALKNGSVIAWGLNTDGQTNVPAEAQSGVTAIAANFNHSLALKDGKVLGWGFNAFGQATPPAEAESGVSAIAAGAYHSLALKNGAVIAWGANSHGEINVPDEAKSGVTAIAAGDSHSLALKDGKVIAWGGNNYGQTTVPVAAESGVSAIAAGGYHSLALKNGPTFAANPTSVDFGNVPLGTTVTKDVAITVDAGYRVGGSVIDPPFVFNYDTCVVSGLGFVGPGTCNVKVSFSPTATGSVGGSLNLGEASVAGGGVLNISIPLQANGDGVENIPPTTTASAASNGSPYSFGTWTNADVAVTLSAVDNEGGSGVAKTEYSLDGVTTWSTYTAPFNVSKEGESTVQYRSVDKAGNVETAQPASVKIDKTAPTITVTAPTDLAVVPIGTALTFTASDSVSGLDAASLKAELSDGTTTTQVSSGYQPGAGVYTLVVKASDAAGNSAQSQPVRFTVYDPAGGFVTGAGFIDSPSGAYVPDPSLVGRAFFGFVSKYEKGATVPSGRTAFEFKVAKLDFRGTSFQWLVVNKASSNAQFKGAGTINGQQDPNGQDYKFQIWATDSSPDTFRIKIWWEDGAGEHPVYDNKVAQAIAEGSIIVHAK